MTSDKTSINGNTNHSDVAEQNLHGLLSKAYKPEQPDAEFAQRLQEHLCIVAKEAAQTRSLRVYQPSATGVAGKDARLRSVRHRLGWLMAAAAAVVAVVLFIHARDPKQAVPAQSEVMPIVEVTKVHRRSEVGGQTLPTSDLRPPASDLR